MKRTAEELCFWWNERTDALYKYYITEGKKEYTAIRLATSETAPPYMDEATFKHIWSNITEIYTTYDACYQSTAFIEWFELELVYDEVVRRKSEEIEEKYRQVDWDKLINELDNIKNIFTDLIEITEQFRDALEENNQ